jgi:DNA polymerase sigma
MPSNSSSTISVSSSTDTCRLRGHDQIASDTHAKLGAELVALAAHLKQKPQEVEIYLYETQRITKAIQTLFPSAEIIPHGSFQMQTALPDA